MSDLTSIQKSKLERLFRMSGGYVLGFSNRTFQTVILDTIGKDIYDEKYSIFGDSKANRLRAFWKIDSNYNVARLCSVLFEHWIEEHQINDAEMDPKDFALLEDCRDIIQKLDQNDISDHINVLTNPDIHDQDFKTLARTIKESIEKNEPEIALDRLHTYVVKYIRTLCDKHGIHYDKGKPLHSFYGEYVKYLKNNNLIESDMTERILKSSISILEAFNDVRNNKSFAHDNKILNYQESLFIFKNISSFIALIESIESNNRTIENDEINLELPF